MCERPTDSLTDSLDARAFMRKYWRFGAFVGLLLPIVGCAVGPDYKRPAMANIPPSYGWKLAQPSDTEIKGDWWKTFHDPVLNDLEGKATNANASLQQAAARVDQSRATARITQSEFFPQISAQPNVQFMHTSPAQVPPLFTGAVYTMPLDLSYEIDVWGRVRRSFESAKNEAQASLADYATVLLSLHGDVAVNYFLLRQMDSEVDLLQQTLKLRQKAVEIMSERFKAGLAPTSDVAQARTRMELTQTQAYDAQRQRADLQDALALLCGAAAPMFHIAPGPATNTVPTVPLGLPSALLERRPDIAAAERRMAAANARIGVAYAAFFPSLSLTGDAGYSSLITATLLNWESRLYQIGPTITLPILTGGRTEAQVKQARAEYNATCAGYRQTVLAGFRDVSDSLNDLHGYRQETESLKRAVAAAHATVDATDQSYASGLVGYLNVVDADQIELEAEVQQIQAAASVRVATVHLYKALGGGFQASPSP